MLWFVLGCVFGDVKALKAEVEALKDEVDELEEELDEQSQVDTGEPVDTEDSGGGDTGETATPEEPFIVPTVRRFTSATGSAGNYTYTNIIEITGDYDMKRVSVSFLTDYDEPEADCIEYVGSSSLYELLVEFWYEDTYSCWAYRYGAVNAGCFEIPANVAELSCD